MEFPQPPQHQLKDLETHLRLRAIEAKRAPEEVENAIDKEAAWQAYTIKIWHTLKRTGAV